MKGVLHAYGQIDGIEAAGLMIDGQLEDFIFDAPAPRLGTIYRAKAIRPAKGMGGMFLDTPDGTAFLRNAKGVSTGSHLTVQVSGYAERGKAIPVTDRWLMKTRHAIVTPGRPGINIARSIRDDDARVRLHEIADPFSGDLRGCGIILRTAAADAEPQDIEASILNALNTAFAVMEDGSTALEKLIEGPSPEEFAHIEWPQGPGGGDITECLGIARGPSLRLSGGGQLTIEPTRALVAADVDSGDGPGGMTVNIAAARALPRLLRIKGLGGQIAVDFTPMPKKNRRGLEQAMTAAFRADDIETALIGWTQMGLYELSRKHARPALHEVFR